MLAREQTPSSDVCLAHMPNLMAVASIPRTQEASPHFCLVLWQPLAQRQPKPPTILFTRGFIVFSSNKNAVGQTRKILPLRCKTVADDA